MYPSTETRYPLYSIPHLSFTITGLPVSPFKNGFGFKGIACWKENSHFIVRFNCVSRAQKITFLLFNSLIRTIELAYYIKYSIFTKTIK